jgi:hypothetical protein
MATKPGGSSLASRPVRYRRQWDGTRLEDHRPRETTLEHVLASFHDFCDSGHRLTTGAAVQRVAISRVPAVADAGRRGQTSSRAS